MRMICWLPRRWIEGPARSADGTFFPSFFAKKTSARVQLPVPVDLRKTPPQIRSRGFRFLWAFFFYSNGRLRTASVEIATHAVHVLLGTFSALLSWLAVCVRWCGGRRAKKALLGRGCTLPTHMAVAFGWQRLHGDTRGRSWGAKLTGVLWVSARGDQAFS